MPQGAVKKKFTGSKSSKSSNHSLGPKKGRHTVIAPKKKARVKQNKAKKELEKAIRGKIEEEITAQASKTIKNFTIIKPVTSTVPSSSSKQVPTTKTAKNS